MKTALKYIALTCFLLIVLYSIVWVGFLWSISKELNAQYANKNISTKSIATQEQYFIKFAKIEPAGFPFKFAIKIINWSEESISSKIECDSPIYVGYDLLKQRMFASYSGETIALYKPIESRFGSKILSNEYLMYIRLPLSLKLIRSIFRNSYNLFEVVNFIKEINLQSGKTQIFDLVDHKKIYDQDYESIKISFKKRKHYTSLEDFLSNIPSQWDIHHLAQVNESSLKKRVSPITLLYGGFWPFSFSGEHRIFIKTGAKTLQDLFKDLEIELVQSNTSSSIHSLKSSMLYKGMINGTSANIYFKANSEFEIKDGFFDYLFELLTYVISNLTQNSAFVNLAKTEITYILNNKDNFKLQELENRKYELDLDLNFANNSKRTETKINNFSIFSGNSGIRLNNESNISKPLNWNLKGLIALSNYDKIIDFVMHNVYMFGKFKMASKESRDLHIEVTKDFLRNISDHPNSISKDITFDYKMDSSNINEGIIGGVGFKKLKSFYDLSLYKKAISKITPNDNIKEQIKTLIPNVTDDQERILEQLILKPTKLDDDVWQKLIQ